MTEQLEDISIKSRSGGKIYLSGKAYGDSGKKYCIESYHPDSGTEEHVKNSSYDYSFFTGGGFLDLESMGCYITDRGDGYYGIVLNEVDIYGCEHVIRLVDTTSITATDIDTTDPVISITIPSDGETFTSPEIAITGVASDDVAISKVETKVGSGSWQDASGTVFWMSSATLAEGSNVIQARATDTSGNTKTDSVTVTYTPEDTTDPVISIESPSDGDTVTVPAALVDGYASDNVGLDKVEVKVGSGSWHAVSQHPTTGYWMTTVTLAEGANTIYAKATDTSGNTKTDTSSVTYTPDVPVFTDVTFKAVDQNNDSVPGVQVVCDGVTSYLGADGEATQYMLVGSSKTATAYEYSDIYSCVDCEESFTVAEGLVVTFTFLKAAPVFILTAPATVTQFEAFEVTVSNSPPNEVVHCYRYDAIWTDKSIGSGTANADGTATFNCITEVTGDIELYACYNPGLIECEKESEHVDVTSNPPAVITIVAPATVTQFEAFEVTVSNSPPNEVVHCYRYDPIWTDKSIGSGTANADGTATFNCITEVTGDIELYACYNPGLIECEKESEHVDVTSNPPAVTDLTLTAPATAKQFEAFTVTAKFEPNKKVWIYREIDIFADTVLGSGVTDAAGNATIECITNVSGSIDIYGCYNPGLWECEVESNSRSRIEVEESTVEFKIEAPESVTVKVPFAVDVQFKPNRGIVVVVKGGLSYVIIGTGDTDADGKAQIGVTLNNTGVREIWAIGEEGLMGDESNHLDISVIDSETDESIIKIETPTLVMAGADFDVSGTVLGVESVQILQVQQWWGLMNDKLLATVTSDAEGKFETTVKIEEFGYYQVYAKVDKPTDWVSKKHTVFVFTWEIVIFLIIAAALIYDKKTGKLGLLKRKRK